MAEHICRVLAFVLSTDGSLNSPFMMSGWELEDPCFDHSFAIYLLGESHVPYLEAGGWCAVARELSSVQSEGNQAEGLPALGPFTSFLTGTPLRCYRHWSDLLGVGMDRYDEIVHRPHTRKRCSY